MTDFELLALEYAESLVAYHGCVMEFERTGGHSRELALEQNRAYNRMCELQNQLNNAAAYVAAQGA